MVETQGVVARIRRPRPWRRYCWRGEVNSVPGTHHQPVGDFVSDGNARREVPVGRVPGSPDIVVQEDQRALQVRHAGLRADRVDRVGVEVIVAVVTLRAGRLNFMAQSEVNGQPRRRPPGILDVPRPRRTLRRGSAGLGGVPRVAGAEQQRGQPVTGGGVGHVGVGAAGRHLVESERRRGAVDDVLEPGIPAPAELQTVRAKLLADVHLGIGGGLRADQVPRVPQPALTVDGENGRSGNIHLAGERGGEAQGSEIEAVTFGNLLLHPASAAEEHIGHHRRADQEGVVQGDVVPLFPAVPVRLRETVEELSLREGLIGLGHAHERGMPLRAGPIQPVIVAVEPGRTHVGSIKVAGECHRVAGLIRHGVHLHDVHGDLVQARRGKRLFGNWSRTYLPGRAGSGLVENGSKITAGVLALTRVSEKSPRR